MWKNNTSPLAVVLFIFIVFYLFAHFFGPIPFSVNSVTTTKSDLFTVQGTGEATAIPDTAELNLGVSKTASTVTVAQTQVNEIINKITDDLKKLGVEEKAIKTTDYSVNPQYDYQSSTQRVTGYEVSATIDVKIQPLEKANQAIDIATKDGATEVGSVQFVLNDAKQKQLEEKARKEAIDAAKTKAESISKISGIKLGRLVDVQEDADNARPVPFAAKGASLEAADAKPATQLNPGENKVTSNVTLSYETF